MAATEKSKSNLKISEEVIAKIVTVAISETPGVTSSAKPGEAIIGKLGRKPAPKGVKISMLEDGVTITAPICVQYGFNLQEVGKAVQENVMHAIENMTELRISAVNVIVNGISFEDNAKQKEKPAKSK